MDDERSAQYATMLCETADGMMLWDLGLEPDSYEVAMCCTDMLAAIQKLNAHISSRRVAAIRDLDGAGHSRAELGSATGLSRQRIQQILDS